MKVARLTATSAHQRLRSAASVTPAAVVCVDTAPGSSVFVDTAPFLPVRRSCTAFLYGSLIRRIVVIASIPRTPYSCQGGIRLRGGTMAASTAVAAGDDGERQRLSKTAVIERALQLADADGLDALTIRKLAAALSVTPMALYWHFRSKEDLLDALAYQVWSEIDVNVDGVTPWSAQLRKMLESLVRVLRAHPSGSQLLIEHEVQNTA